MWGVGPVGFRSVDEMSADEMKQTFMNDSADLCHNDSQRILSGKEKNPESEHENIRCGERGSCSLNTKQGSGRPDTVLANRYFVVFPKVWVWVLGTPKSSILIGFSTINHPFSGTPIFGNTQMKAQRRPAITVGVIPPSIIDTHSARVTTHTQPQIQ